MSRVEMSSGDQEPSHDQPIAISVRERNKGNQILTIDTLDLPAADAEQIFTLLMGTQGVREPMKTFPVIGKPGITLSCTAPPEVIALVQSQIMFATLGRKIFPRNVLDASN